MRNLQKSILWVLAGLVIGLLALGLLGGGAMAGESGPRSAQMAPTFQMGSAHYGLNWNVSAAGGGTISSAHFIVSSTMGQPAIGMADSTHFDVCSGYWCWPGSSPFDGDPEITVSPSALAFGSQDVNAGPTPSQMVTISNDGDANLQVSSVGLTGTNPGQFAIQSDSGETNLGPGAKRTLQVAFNPSSTGAKSANLRIVSSDADEATVNVALSGTGSSQGNGNNGIYLPLVFKNH